MRGCVRNDAWRECGLWINAGVYEEGGLTRVWINAVVCDECVLARVWINYMGNAD